MCHSVLDKEDSPEKAVEKSPETTGTTVQQSLFGSSSTTDNNTSVTNSKLAKNAFTSLASSTSSRYGVISIRVSE